MLGDSECHKVCVLSEEAEDLADWDWRIGARAFRVHRRHFDRAAAREHKKSYVDLRVYESTLHVGGAGLPVLR